MSTATEHLSNYLAAFDELHPTEEAAWLHSLRENAFARFCKTGFPTTHDEDWRFTNISELARTPFRPARASHALRPIDIERWNLPGAVCGLVFVNGILSPELSHRGLPGTTGLPPGVEADSLTRLMESNPSALERHLGRYLDTSRDAFAALNTAFMTGGAYVYIPRNVALEGPIHLLFVSVDDGSPAMVHPRNLIVAEESCQAAIVEDYVSFDDAPTAAAFSNSVTELVAGANSVVSHLMLEREHRRTYNVSTLRIEQARDANVASHSVLLGGALVRNNVHPVLSGEGGECLINGLFVGSGTQHMDNYMYVEHASPHCGSRQFYNGILDERAHGVFHGRIIVHKDAQKTDAKQTNRNLLLSDTAQIDTKPQLEIYADDVKCTHGATIGQIDEEALFYLRSRGISEAAARTQLLAAFAGECTTRMREEPVRRYVERLVRESLFQLASTDHDLADALKETA